MNLIYVKTIFGSQCMYDNNISEESRISGSSHIFLDKHTLISLIAWTPCQCISISAYESMLRPYLLLNVCMITASMRRALNLGLAISFLINTLLYLSLPKPPCQCLSISAYESMLRLYLLLDIYLQLVRSCPTLTQRHQPQQKWWRTWRLCSSSWR